jgi:hypothetical protein
MAPRKPRAASRVLYDSTHPALTIHFEREVYEKVVEFCARSELTRSEVVRRALVSVESLVEAIVARDRDQWLMQGWSAGYAEGRRVGGEEGQSSGYHAAVVAFRLAYRCPRCGREVVLRAHSPDAVHILELMAAMPWVHDGCHASKARGRDKDGWEQVSAD